jgi:hypothetical protein
MENQREEKEETAVEKNLKVESVVFTRKLIDVDVWLSTLSPEGQWLSI